jgi:hypothetical protein
VTNLAYCIQLLHVLLRMWEADIQFQHSLLQTCTYLNYSNHWQECPKFEQDNHNINLHHRENLIHHSKLHFLKNVLHFFKILFNYKIHYTYGKRATSVPDLRFLQQ